MNRKFWKDAKKLLYYVLNNTILLYLSDYLNFNDDHILLLKLTLKSKTCFPFKTENVFSQFFSSIPL